MDRRTLTMIVKCDCISAFNVLSVSQDDMAQRAELATTISDLSTSWKACTHAIRN